MTQITDKVNAIEVPDDAEYLEICNYGLNDTLEYKHHIDGKEVYEMDDLPPGTWRFLFTTKEATEEDARKVVSEVVLRKKVRYTDYTGEYMWYNTALESLASLLRSKGLDDRNYALIEKDGV